MSKKGNDSPIDLKLLRDLIGVMDKGKLTKLSVKEKGGLEVCLERQGEAAPVAHAPKAHFTPTTHHEAPAKPAKKESESGHLITSPMVGTFYRSPSPDDPAFVNVGDRVDENTVVCIVEAMKVMNEVKAGKSGVVKEVLIDNMQPVEFGTKLFRIE